MTQGVPAPAAAVVLAQAPGGSGTFYYLAVLTGRGRATDTAFLGDRITVRSLAVRSGTITVNLLTRRPDQPMAATPTVPVGRRFRLEGGLPLALPA